MSNSRDFKSHSFYEAIRRQGLKYCSRCDQALNPEAFGKNKNTPDGLAHYCKSCKRKRDKNEYRSQGKARRKHRRLSFKKQLVAIMGDGCVRCGYVEFYSGLEFHHIDPQKKETELAKFLSSSVLAITDELTNELDKCALLCANCHRALHSEDWQPKWIKREGVGWMLDN